MFSVEWLVGQAAKGSEPAGQSSGSIGRIAYNKYTVCFVNTWGFNSCAVYNLQGFSYTLSKEQTEHFFAFLESDVFSKAGWLAKEAYFLLTSYQCKQNDALISHPCVKKIDSFINKAHGGNTLSLFRYSKGKDFTNATS